jgi:hypothetical protein
MEDNADADRRVKIKFKDLTVSFKLNRQPVELKKLKKRKKLNNNKEIGICITNNEFRDPKRYLNVIESRKEYWRIVLNDEEQEEIERELRKKANC